MTFAGWQVVHVIGLGNDPLFLKMNQAQVLCLGKVIKPKVNHDHGGGSEVLGNDTTINIAGASGNFELNVFMPVIAYNLLPINPVAW